MKINYWLCCLVIAASAFSGCSDSSTPDPPDGDEEPAPSDLTVKLYNAGSSPWVSALIEDSLGNILISGEENETDLFAVQTDSTGTESWNKYYSSGTNFVSVNGMFQESSGYMIAGSLNNTEGSLFKMAIDNYGNASPATYYDCGGYMDSVSNDAVKLVDGTVVYAGTSDYADDCSTFIDYGNALMTGITPAGLQAYRSSYNYSTGYSEAFNSVAETGGGGIAAAGYARVYDDGSGYSGPKQAILVKYSGETVLWTKNYGYHSADGGNNGVVDLVETSDGGFALLRWSGYGYQMYVQKVDSTGSELWFANIGEGNNSYIGRRITQAPDGSLMAAGSGYANSQQTGAVIKISGTDGSKIWEYYIPDYTPTAICKVSSGGYIAAGSVFVESTFKIFAFKLDEAGKRVW